MNEDITKIIDVAVHAPSGENCQPWKFEVKANNILVFNIPEADQSLYNFEQKGSYVAHGALIENINICASNFGYKTTIDIFPNTSDLTHVATIMLDKTELKADRLVEYIKKRCTNRKMYNGLKLSLEQKKLLKNAAIETGFGDLRLVDETEKLESLGQNLAVNELVLFENKSIHDFFYSHILWKEEDQHKAGGFYIKTLEFLPHQLKAVKLFKNWSILNILNKILKISKMISKENAQKYSQSGTIGAIVSNGFSKKDYVNAGRAVQRVWLTATKLGLSVHPCTGVLYFFDRIRGGERSVFSKSHILEIEKSYNNIVSSFDAQEKCIPMLFRIGYSGEPSARAMRMNPQIILK